MMYRQLHFGRDEPILEPEIPIVDAGHHLFVRPGIRYLFDDYLADVRAGHRIVASVYIETNSFTRPDGPESMRPLGEIEFANGMGAMSASGVFGDHRICAGIVGHADLRLGDEIAAYLDHAIQVAPERFRGIRQGANHHPSEAPYRYMPSRPPRGLLLDPAFRAGFRHLATRGLSFDAAVFHHQLPELADLADAFPETAIILNHGGLAVGMDMGSHSRAEVFAEWRNALREIARRPNVVCKVGGLGLPFWGFGFETRADPIGYAELAATWGPYVQTAIEIFGPHRCVMESDYPVESLSCGFVPLWNALKYIVHSATPAEKVALFHGTAARVYRIPLLNLTDAVLSSACEREI
ncbi:MAG: amidohydrolase family protein [Bryobacteraceae bacterium]